jgi:hypothetical protein
MRVFTVNWNQDKDETIVQSSDDFKALDTLAKLDILKDVINDLREMYSANKKEWRVSVPSKRKIIIDKARERAMEAYRYRSESWTYKTIGIEMGVSPGRAQQLVQKAERLLKREKELRGRE